MTNITDPQPQCVSSVKHLIQCSYPLLLSLIHQYEKADGLTQSNSTESLSESTLKPASRQRPPPGTIPFNFLTQLLVSHTTLTLPSITAVLQHMPVIPTTHTDIDGSQSIVSLIDYNNFFSRVLFGNTDYNCDGM